MSQDKPVLVEGWGMGPDGDKDVLAFINDTPLLLSLLYDLDLLPEQHPDHESPAWDKIFTITNHWREAALERQGSGWIAVSERHPVNEPEVWSEPVLCLFDSGVMSVESCIIYRNMEASWNLAPGVTAIVTHWMPLPPPPQAQDAQTWEKKSHEFVDCYVEHNPQHGYYTVSEPPQVELPKPDHAANSPAPGPASGSPDGDVEAT